VSRKKERKKERKEYILTYLLPDNNGTSSIYCKRNLNDDDDMMPFVLYVLHVAAKPSV